VVWQLRGEEEGEERETRAARLIGVTFFALVLYLAVEGIRDLVTHARPGQSAAALAVTGTALVVMPGLAVAKRRTGHALGNRMLIAADRSRRRTGPRPGGRADGRAQRRRAGQAASRTHELLLLAKSAPRPGQARVDGGEAG
jgi:hypothetical protein